MKAKYKGNDMIVIFEGNIPDFDGITCPCKWNIQTNPQEKIGDLINKFYKLSGVDSKNIKLYFGKKLLTINTKDTVDEIGLKNNPKININVIIPEAFIDKYKKGEIEFKIYIKFIQNSQNSAYNCNKDLKGILKLCLLKEIASKIDDSVIANLKSDKKYDIFYFILKVLKDSCLDLEENYDIKESIKEIIKKDRGKNIMNFSNFVEENIDSNRLQWIINFLKGYDLQEIKDTKARLGKYAQYNEWLEKELNRYIRESVFEFSVVSFVVIERQDYDTFEKERAKCPNRVDKLLLHGTQIHPISCILTGVFYKSEVRCIQHGKGVYFTDSLDYCWFYGGSIDNRQNTNIIPDIGEMFTAVSSLVYYDKKGFLKVNDYQTRIQPGKNEINFAYAGCDLETIVNPDYTKFVGTEYVVWELDQICPLISIKFRREEYCVIWRDDNFSEKAVYNNEFDETFKNYLKERMKYIKQTSKYNIYPCETTEEALQLVKRKKYNKIILLSNVGKNRVGEQFVDEARKIIGNEVLVLFVAYMNNHLNWIKEKKNALFCNKSEFYEEYLDCFTDESKLKEVIKQLENYYEVTFNIDYDSFLQFPLYKNKGEYSGLSF